MDILTKIIGYALAGFGCVNNMDDVYGLGCYLIDNGATLLAH